MVSNELLSKHMSTTLTTQKKCKHIESLIDGERTFYKNISSLRATLVQSKLQFLANCFVCH